MSTPLIVRLEVERLKQTLVAAISPLQISADVTVAVEAAIADFDWGREVQSAAADILREALISAMRSACYEVARSPEFKAVLAEKFKEALNV